jgi:hypothetical protein
MTDTSTIGLTRSRLLRASVAGLAALGGGAALGAARDDGSSLAAPSAAGDARILGLFLVLEQAQEAFYRRAIERGGLDGELLRFAETVADQEAAHVAMLARRLGRAPKRFTPPDPAAPVDTPEAFRTSAIALEELVVATYIGQSANLTRPAIAPIAQLTSVEARQVAWIRDLAGVSPAPRAADPGRPAAAVVAELRRRRYLA